MNHRLSVLIVIAWTLTLFIVTPMTSAQDEGEAAFDPVLIATDYIGLALTGDFEAAAELHDETMTSVFPPDIFAATWAQIFGEAGEFQTQELLAIQDVQGFEVVQLLVSFENGEFVVNVPIDAEGAVAGLNAVPLTSPPYVDADTFTETQITVNAGIDWELPGSLVLPEGDGPFPAVVILPGSGPTDRDSTVGPNKPLRDLAHGLASQGIASVRFDKRSLIYTQQVTDNLDFTLDDEYTDDALAAVEVLREQDAINDTQIFMIGHSLGATGALRALNQSDQLAGGILMAGSPRPLAETAIQQIDYLRTLESNQSDAAQAQFDAVLDQLEQVGDIDADTPTDRIIFGAYPPYWLDLNANPVGPLAASLDAPLLLLQGERDYQVTLTEDFEGWRDILADKDNATFISYTTLNHLFLEGASATGDPSTPDEYAIPGNVPEAVVNDIVEWITNQS